MSVYMKLGVAFCAIALIVGAGSSALAEEPTDQKSDWEFAVTPYMWGLSLSGNTTVEGQKSDVDSSFKDIWDELNIASMVAFEGRKGRWGFYGDLIYANLGKETKAAGIRIDPSINVMWVTAAGFYRLGTWGLSDKTGLAKPSVTVDAFAGARYTYLDISLDLKGIADAEGDKQWVDPIIGSRATFDLTDHWSLSLEGSIGGFGLGSDIAWNTWALIGYRFDLFGENNATVFGGYRALHQDYSDGSGADKFEWDVTLHGPIAGLRIAF